MKNSISRFKSIYTISLLFITAFATVSCSNPAGNDEEQEEHHAPQGAVLKMNGMNVVVYEEGEITGQIEVAAGQETSLITIFFIAEDGDEFQPEETEFELRWSVGNTEVADVEQHAEDGAWSFHISGISSGDTGVVFQLFHTGEGHSDFETPSIPVTVN